jgi:hypothetical protein
MKAKLLFVVLIVALAAMTSTLLAQQPEDGLTPLGDDGLPIGWVQQVQLSGCVFSETWHGEVGVRYVDPLLFEAPVDLITVQVDRTGNVAGSAWIRTEGSTVRMNSGGRIFGVEGCLSLADLLIFTIENFGPFERAHLAELAEELGYEPDEFLAMPGAVINMDEEVLIRPEDCPVPPELPQ